MVQQHAVAAPDRLGDATQALVGQALGGEVLDDGVEQAPAGRWTRLLPPPPGPPPPVRRSLVRSCTKWYTPSEDGPSRTGEESDREEGSHGPAGDRRDSRRRARSPASVYALLADGSTWPEWSPIDAFTLLEPGAGTPEGLGAVRLFTTGRHRSRERVVECRPGEVFSYVLERGCRCGTTGRSITLTPLPAAPVDQLALDLPAQGARHGLALSPRTGQVHQADRGGTGRRGGRGAPFLVQVVAVAGGVPGTTGSTVSPGHRRLYEARSLVI